jgi:SAM-dependent methyltransferase
VASAPAERENQSMRTLRALAVEAALAQPLTEELLANAGITPGMRVLALGYGLADLALLLAERVGPGGTVLGVNEHPDIVIDARRRAREEGFDQVEFRAAALDELRLDAPVDAAIGRFVLMRERNPVEAIRMAAGAVRDGGRIIFHEWHYDSIRWEQTSDWPRVLLYRRFAEWSLESLRRRHVSVDIGLRLANLFAEAGLPLPAMRTDLRAVNGSCAWGYAFFQETLRDLLPTIERCGLGHAHDVDVDTFAARLQHETTAVGGHLFLPLQVGAWARVEAL